MSMTLDFDLIVQALSKEKSAPPPPPRLIFADGRAWNEILASLHGQEWTEEKHQQFLKELVEVNQARIITEAQAIMFAMALTPNPQDRDAYGLARHYQRLFRHGGLVERLGQPTVLATLARRHNTEWLKTQALTTSRVFI
jgi:hypothetical protein